MKTKHSCIKGLTVFITIISILLVPAIETSADNAVLAQKPVLTQQPDVAAECVVAMVVIVVGGFIIIKLVHLCQKVLPRLQPPSTNNVDGNIILKGLPPGNKPFGNHKSLSDTNMYAAWFILGQDTSDSLTVSGAALNISFTNGLLGQPTWNTPAEMVSPAVFKSQLAAYGLTMSPFSSSFSSNGLPVSSLSNIQLVNGVLVVGCGTSTVTTTNVFQHSADLNTWTSYVTNIIVGGSIQGRITDSAAPAGNGYYRMLILY